MDLSYLSEKEQKAVAAAASENKVKLNPKNAAAIRAGIWQYYAEDPGNCGFRGKSEEKRCGQHQASDDSVPEVFCGSEGSRSGRYVGKGSGSVVPKGGQQILFSKEELKSLDTKYFAVIVADEYDCNGNVPEYGALLVYP